MIDYDLHSERLKVNTKPVKIRIDSEPYVAFLSRGFVPAIDVYDLRLKRHYSLIINSMSVSSVLLELAKVHGCLLNLQIWINKESDDKFAKYEISLS